MQTTVPPESTAAEQSARRELKLSALPVNPIIASVSALLGPILNLFLRSPASPPVARPLAPPRNLRSTARCHPASSRSHLELISKSSRIHLEAASGEHPSRGPVNNVRGTANVKIGGHSHG